MRWVKRIGIGLAALVLLAAVGVFALVQTSKARQSKRYDVKTAGFAIPEGPAALAEGQRLFRARGCAECHGDDAGGKTFIDEPPLGRIVASNLTSATAKYTTEDWSRAVRHGLAPDGRPLVMMPAHEYWAYGDADLGQIVAFVASLPVVSRPLPAHDLGALSHVLHVCGAFPLLPAELIDHDKPRPAPPAIIPSAEFGGYLAAGCTGCHGATLAGGPIPGAPQAAVGIPSNLTPHETGLGKWTEADFRTLLRTGKRPDGTEVNAKWMPWGVYKYMSDTEIAAVWAYVSKLPAKPFGER